MICQDWADGEKSAGGQRDRNLGKRAAAGQGAGSGPFAEARIDPQGSLRLSQPPPAVFGSPAVPPRGSRRGSSSHGGAWRPASETAARGGAQALVGY